MSTIDPLVIRQKYIDKFQDLYFKKYGVKLTDEQATRDATDFFNLMWVLIKPLPKKVVK